MGFTSSITDVDEITKKVSVQVPADDVQKELDVALGRVMKDATIKGFRKGKAPKSIVEKLHGERVRAEVTERLVSKALQELIKEHQIEMVGYPRIDLEPFKAGEELKFEADIDLFPRPTVSGYEKFSIEIPKREIQDEHVDETLKRFQDGQAQLREIKDRDVIQDGDVIQGTITVKIGDEETSKPEPLNAQLGKQELHEDIEKGLIGSKLGEQIRVDSAFPEDHQNEALRGKSAVYEVTVEAISEKILPELDDSFAKQSGLGVETLLEFKLKIREELTKSAETESRSDAQAKIIDQILEQNSFKVPQSLIDDEIRSLMVRQRLIDPQKVDPNKVSVEPFREYFGEPAEKRVKTSIMVDRIAEQEKLDLSPDEHEAAIVRVAEDNGIPADEVRKYLQQNEAASSFRLEQTRNKVLDFLYARATINYVEEEKK